MGRKRKDSQPFTHHPSRIPHHRRGERLILVLGGAASGKSEAALAMAGNVGPKAFVATGQPLDDEMAERIRRHQASRQADWRTEEVPLDLAGWFDKQGRTYRTILVDCLTLWLSNLQGRSVPESQVPALVSELLRAIRAVKARVVVVSNELGLGLVPTETSSRRFRDLAGSVNQQVAKEADEVYFIVSGMPLRLK
ncbi:MAG: bifunctional adenosylcobinamide kinase/adenosylcobinamide-phosphate guanylyltransferase [Nitrospira sp.]|nr:bifunctional adenosylcobinamide kinase/adenosylcobinamide-phosphate guanylyltransferase [Nitrospira sp.]